MPALVTRSSAAALGRPRAFRFDVPAGDEHLAAMRHSVVSSAENRPGVYRMIAPDGEIVYVGKSKQVRTRLLSYFRASYPEDKGARILREAARLEWDYHPSEFAALLHELRLIKRYRPRFNVAMKRDARHYAFVRLSRGPAPKLNVVRGPGDDDATVYYGPFVGAARVEEAVRELNDVLGLRDCRASQPVHFADQRELFVLPARTPGCIRHEIRKCLGPCIGGCTVADYMAQVALARAFLDGVDDAPMAVLRERMVAASEALEFERAAAYRDKLARLEALREQFQRLRFAVETLSFVYDVPGSDGQDRSYVIRRGVVRAELSTPRTARERRALQSLVDDIFGAAAPSGAGIPTHEIDELLLMSSWFRKFPDELARTRRVA